MYDFLIVGSGLFGATFANIAKRQGHKVLVLEKRNYIGGNCADVYIKDINVHLHGPHVFHTSNKLVWEFVNKHIKFQHYMHRVKAKSNNKFYSLPINLTTFYSVWGCSTPAEAKFALDKAKEPWNHIKQPRNFEEWVLTQVGNELYELLIYNYTKKQWNKEPSKLPAFIAKRLPIRFTWDDNYYNDIYQGVPITCYNDLFYSLLEGVEVITGTNYLTNKDYYDSIAKNTIYTGPIDTYFNYEYGKLEYRSLRFENDFYDETKQGLAQLNFTDDTISATRSIEHKCFNTIGMLENKIKHTIVTNEIPQTHNITNEPYYPINDEKNNNVYDEYKKLALKEKNKSNPVHFGGRLAEYQYFDMDKTVKSSIDLAIQIFGTKILSDL